MIYFIPIINKYLNEIINLISKKDYKSITKLLKMEEAPPIFNYKNDSSNDVSVKYIVDYISNLSEFIDNFGENKIVNIYDLELLIYAYDDNLIIHPSNNKKYPSYFFYEVEGTMYELNNDHMYFKIKTSDIDSDEDYINDKESYEKFIIDNIYTHIVE